jgi:hypothetical protein
MIFLKIYKLLIYKYNYMINIILIILIIILYLISQNDFFSNVGFNDNIYKETNNENIEDNAQLSNDYKLDNDFNCYIYGCNSSRNDIIEWIGTDYNKKEIFKDDKNNFFIFNNGFLNKIDKIDTKKININNYSLSIPTTQIDNNIKLKINLKYEDYIFFGYLTNNYYKIQYLVYEKPIVTEIENNQLFEYLAIKIIDNKYQVIHKIPLRSKIDNLEIVWINYGPISLGPLVFTKTINFYK